MKTPQAPPTLTSSDLEELTGLTDRRHRQLAEQGHIPKPSNGLWPAKEVLQCLFRYYRSHGNEPEKLTAERLRLTKAQADHLEYRQAILARKYVAIDDVLPAWRFIAENIAARIRACDQLPDKVRDDLLRSCAEIPLDDYFRDQPTPPPPQS